MKKKKLPKFLQPFLWSVKIDDLDIKKDKVYVVNQILAFGDIEALKWLFNNYSFAAIKRVFLSRSMRIYRDSAFNFVKKNLLGINKPLNTKKYVAVPL